MGPTERVAPLRCPLCDNFEHRRETAVRCHLVERHKVDLDRSQIVVPVVTGSRSDDTVKMRDHPRRSASVKSASNAGGRQFFDSVLIMINLTS